MKIHQRRSNSANFVPNRSAGSPRLKTCGNADFRQRRTRRALLPDDRHRQRATSAVRRAPTLILPRRGPGVGWGAGEIIADVNILLGWSTSKYYDDHKSGGGPGAAIFGRKNMRSTPVIPLLGRDVH